MATPRKGKPLNEPDFIYPVAPRMVFPRFFMQVNAIFYLFAFLHSYLVSVDHRPFMISTRTTVFVFQAPCWPSMLAVVWAISVWGTDVCLCVCVCRDACVTCRGLEKTVLSRQIRCVDFFLKGMPCPKNTEAWTIYKYKYDWKRLLDIVSNISLEVR